MVRLSELKLRISSHRRVILLGVLVLLLAWGGYKAWRLWGLARSLQARLHEVQALVDDEAEVDLGQAGANLRGAHADLHALRDEVALFMPLTRFLGWVPRVGGDLRAAPALLDVALGVTEAGTMAFDGVEPLLALVEGEEAGGEPLALVLQTLSDARPDLESAQARLATALARRNEIDDAALSDYTADLLDRLDRYLPLVETALDGARLLPDLLGASGQRAYLVMAQNDDELRATGGFISAVGTLILDGGEIGEIAFEDSYAVDDFSHPYPFAPEPFWRYMRIQPWAFRDANWSPDFGTAAQKAIELYQISRDLEVDGVIVVDQYALQKVVAALEPLQVEGWPEAVTGENVISLMRSAWASGEVEKGEKGFGQWWKQRKSFMGDLIGAVRTKVEGSPGEVNWVALGRAALQVLDERHVLVWLSDTGAAADLLAERGWDGAIRQVDGDYLMVVDTNMGFNKVNAHIKANLNYRVEIKADGAAQATLTVRHVNPSSGDAACNPHPHYGAGYDDLVNRCYWDYLRVYAPGGSKLRDATAHPVAADWLISAEAQSGEAEILPQEKGKAVFASFFVLPRGQETQTHLVYQLPPATLERVEEGWRYRLLVQKQSGTKAVPLQVTLTLPPGANVVSAEPAARYPEPSKVVFRTTLATDQTFEVIFNASEGEGHD
jgi:hypothetical protein